MLSPAVLPEPEQPSSMVSLEEALKAYSPLLPPLLLLHALTSKTSGILPTAPKPLFSHPWGPTGRGLLPNPHPAAGSGPEAFRLREDWLPQDHVG